MENHSDNNLLMFSHLSYRGHTGLCYKLHIYLLMTVELINLFIKRFSYVYLQHWAFSDIRTGHVLNKCLSDPSVNQGEDVTSCAC